MEKHFSFFSFMFKIINILSERIWLHYNIQVITSLLQLKSLNCKNTFAIISDATKIIYEHYGVDKYLYAIGLSVDPAYRGYGLGKDILKIRYDSENKVYMLKN